MNRTTRTASSFLRVLGGQARQIVTVLSVGPATAVCAVEIVHPDGTISQDRLTAIMRAAIPAHVLQHIKDKSRL